MGDTIIAEESEYINCRPIMLNFHASINVDRTLSLLTRSRGWFEDNVYWYCVGQAKYGEANVSNHELVGVVAKSCALAGFMIES